MLFCLSLFLRPFFQTAEMLPFLLRRGTLIFRLHFANPSADQRDTLGVYEPFA